MLSLPESCIGFELAFPCSRILALAAAQPSLAMCPIPWSPFKNDIRNKLFEGRGWENVACPLAGQCKQANMARARHAMRAPMAWIFFFFDVAGNLRLPANCWKSWSWFPQFPWLIRRRKRYCRCTCCRSKRYLLFTPTQSNFLQEKAQKFCTGTSPSLFSWSHSSCLRASARQSCHTRHLSPACSLRWIDGLCRSASPWAGYFATGQGKQASPWRLTAQCPCKKCLR